MAASIERRATRYAPSAAAPTSVVAGGIAFGLLTLSLWLLVVLWSDLGRPWGPSVSALIAVAVLGLHVALVRRRASAFDPIVWIPVSMLLFYFGVPIGIDWLRADVWYGYDVYRIGAIPRNLDRGFCSALLGMCGFIFGAYLSGIRDMSQCQEPVRPRDRSLALPGYLFTALSIVMTAVGVAIVGPETVFGYYQDWWAAKTAGADARWVDVGITFMQGGVYALLASDDRRHPARRYVAYLVGFAIIAMAVQKGARAQLIAFGIGAGWCYSQRIRRVHPSVVVACALTALLVLPIIAEWRQSRSIEDSKRSTIHELASAAFIEMGGTGYTLAYTMDFIPRFKPYAWGVTYRDALYQAIPNFGLTPGKSWGLSAVEDTPSTWLTTMLSPAWAAQGGGYGSSMVTELYFNFGLPGIALGTVLMGFLTGRIRNASSRSDLRLVLSALVFAGMAIHVRNLIGAPLKMMLWPVIGLFVVRFAISPLTTSFQRHQRHPTASTTPPLRPSASVERSDPSR